MRTTTFSQPEPCQNKFYTRQGEVVVASGDLTRDEAVAFCNKSGRTWVPIRSRKDFDEVSSRLRNCFSIVYPARGNFNDAVFESRSTRSWLVKLNDESALLSEGSSGKGTEAGEEQLVALVPAMGRLSFLPDESSSYGAMCLMKQPVNLQAEVNSGTQTSEFLIPAILSIAIVAVFILLSLGCNAIFERRRRASAVSAAPQPGTVDGNLYESPLPAPQSSIANGEDHVYMAMDSFVDHTYQVVDDCPSNVYEQPIQSSHV